MFCSQCGKELPENSKFCTECGKNLLVSSEIITGTKAKPHMVSKNGDNMGQIIEPSVEMPNLDSKNAEPQMQTQVSKFKIIIWATVIFLVILLVASSIFDLILYGLGLDTEFAGALAAVTAGIFAGWYYLAEKEKKIKAQTNYAQSNKITFSGSMAREKFFLGLEIIIVIAFFVICALFAFNIFKASINYEPLNSSNIGDKNTIIPTQKILNINKEQYVEETLRCKTIGEEYKNVYTQGKITYFDADYSPKLDICLIMYEYEYNVVGWGNKIFTTSTIKDLSGKYDSHCLINSDDPIFDNTRAKFLYLVRGFVFPNLPEGYIQNIKSECNISF